MFNLPNPGSNPANPFYYRSIEEQRRALQEAVTVELQFKKDADGKKAGGKKVRDKVYKMTFKNDAEMNKFMDTNAKILDEGTEELEESTPEYRAMMKRYKGSDMEKVFKILDKEGFRMGEQSDTLVRNMLKKHRGNVKKAADQIMKDNPGMFDVNRMMMDHVEIDEAEVYKRPVKVSALGGQKFHAVVENGKIVAAGMTEKEARKMKKFGQQVRELPGAKVGQLVKEDVEQVDEMSAKQHYNKMVAQGKVGRGGRLVTPIDKDRFPNREKEGLEGPFRSRKSGQVYYYDKKAGKYYDPLSDMFLQVKDVMENTASYDIDEYLAEEND